MFRNLRMYRVFTKWPETEELLSEVLSNVAFKPCDAYSEKSAGWESPSDNPNGPLCRRLAGADLLQLRTQSRVLPVAAVKEAVEERVADYRERTGEDPGRRDMRRLKEETRDSLLPKALLKSDRLHALFLQSEGVLAVDTASAPKAEWLLDHLRPALGRLQAVPLAFKSPVGGLLSRLFLGKAVAGFDVGRECRMQEMADSRSHATWREMDLDDATIRQHVVDGMRITQLGLMYDNVMSCVISEDAVISKIKFAGGEAEDVTDDEDPQMRQDAEFVLLTGTLQRLLKDLKKNLEGYSEAGPAAPDAS
ncbi:recombination-associated protein RdgC [Elongatibacter sediminis]|uniref:Recombination-associated protein RdgC n=1 Tax=Elongatibacter sediminis TaxID=3119006 RepID=A0AAW9RF13_9GAMM